MPKVEPQANNNAPKEETQNTLSRRQLLKAIVATGGAITASTLLPSEWGRPVVEVGVLPAHAQELSPTETPTPEPEPAIIETCHTANVNGEPYILPFDTLETWAQINGPTLEGILIRRTINLDEPGHPSHGVIDVTEGPTDATGTFWPLDFDLSTIVPLISPGIDRIVVDWVFVDPTEGTGGCSNYVEIVGDL